jgi:hypothetical protein
MGSNETRFVTTAIIWTAATAMTIVLSVVNGGENFSIPAVVIFMIAAAVSTLGIWQSPFVGSDSGSAKAESEKAKRSSKLERLVSGLSDDEVNELRNRLMTDNDGELVSLEEVMRQRK